jgi:phage-related protein
VNVTALQKFLGIMVIVAASIIYSKVKPMQNALDPIFNLLKSPMKVIAAIVGLIIKIIMLPFSLISGLLKRNKAQSF